MVGIAVLGTDFDEVLRYLRHSRLPGGGDFVGKGLIAVAAAGAGMLSIGVGFASADDGNGIVAVTGGRENGDANMATVSTSILPLPGGHTVALLQNHGCTKVVCTGGGGLVDMAAGWATIDR